MRRRGADFHRALPRLLATFRMNGSQRTDRASTAECVRLPPLLSWPGPARRGKPSTNMKLAGTRVFTGVDAYLWPLGNSCSPYGGRFYCFSFASHHFSLSAHQHLAHELFYVLPFFFLLLSRVCGHVNVRFNIIETRNINGLSGISIYLLFSRIKIIFVKSFFLLGNELVI